MSTTKKSNATVKNEPATKAGQSPVDEVVDEVVSEFDGDITDEPDSEIGIRKELVSLGTPVPPFSPVRTTAEQFAFAVMQSPLLERLLGGLPLEDRKYQDLTVPRYLAQRCFAFATDFHDEMEKLTIAKNKADYEQATKL